MFVSRFLLVLFALFGSLNLAFAGDAPDRFRDLKVYTTSAPDAKDPARIVATMQFRNQGKKPLKLTATLAANEKIGFKGGRFEKELAAGANADWSFDLRPTDGLKREILQGDISFGGTKDRDLYVAVQGPDPAGFKPNRIEVITARGQVTATYAPRTQAAIEADYAKWTAAKNQNRITLAANGQSKYSIVLGSLFKNGADGKPLTFEQLAAAKDLKPAEQSLIAAAKDLQRAIQLKSGATLPIALGPAPNPAQAIYIVINKDRIYGFDDYALQTNSSGAVAINAGTLEGLRSGVYGLLTDHLDCHWFLPNQLGEEIVIPADKTVSLPADLAELKSASFFSATGLCWGNSRPWDYRNRCFLNDGRMVFGHAWDGLVPPSEQAYKEHPDWFARDRQGKILDFSKRGAGWSGTNFCSTSPEVIAMVAKKINERFDADPNAIVMSLDPNDYAPMCLCDRCLALDKSFGVTREDGRQVSDRLLHFSREVYNRLDAKHKQKFLGILAYGYQIDLPKGATAHDHHAAMLCQFPRLFDHSRPFNDPTSKYARKFGDLVKGWGSRLKQLGFYDYYGHYTYFGPWAIINKIREDLPAFREAGGTFVMLEAQPNFGIQGMNHYISARLVWDLNSDVDLLMEEYFRKFYGPAADPMRKFWLGAEKQFAFERPAASTADLVAARPGFWEELDANLKEAEKRVAGAEQRYRDRIQFNRDGFDLGWKMHLTEAKYLPAKGSENFDGAIAEVQKQQPYVDGLKKKYSGADGYWPILMPTYFYPDVNDLMSRKQLAIEAKKNPQPSILGEEE